MDKAWLELAGKKLLMARNLSESTTNWVDPDCPYISEDFTEDHIDSLFDKGFIHCTKEDYLSIGDMFGFEGPCCIYAISKFISEKDETVELNIGSTDPFKLWFNGNLTVVQPECRRFGPYDDIVRLNLKEGINTFVVKLIRMGYSQKFAVVMREAPYLHIGPIKTDLKYLLEA